MNAEKPAWHPPYPVGRKRAAVTEWQFHVPEGSPLASMQGMLEFGKGVNDLQPLNELTIDVD